MESILETEAATILQFFAGVRGTLSVTFEEGTWSAWLYDLLKPRVDKLRVCNPRKCGGYHAKWYPYRDLIDRVLSAIAPYASDQIFFTFFQLIA